jgi:hypothetical protein
MNTRWTLFAALLTVATMTQAAVPGEIIAVTNHQEGRVAWAVVSPDGSNLTYLPCLGDPTHGGVPRFFLRTGPYGNVLHVDSQNRPDRWSNEHWEPSTRTARSPSSSATRVTSSFPTSGGHPTAT